MTLKNLRKRSVSGASHFTRIKNTRNSHGFCMSPSMWRSNIFKFEQDFHYFRKSTFQTYQNAFGIHMFFECLHPCDGAHFSNLTRIFTIFEKQKKTIDFLVILFTKKSNVVLHFLGPDAKRWAVRRCPDATSAWQVPKSRRMPSNHSEAQKYQNWSLSK